MIKTAFNRSDGQGSRTFDEFREKQNIIARRLYEKVIFQN